MDAARPQWAGMGVPLVALDSVLFTGGLAAPRRRWWRRGGRRQARCRSGCRACCKCRAPPSRGQARPPTVSAAALWLSRRGSWLCHSRLPRSTAPALAAALLPACSGAGSARPPEPAGPAQQQPRPAAVLAVPAGAAHHRPVRPSRQIRQRRPGRQPAAHRAPAGGGRQHGPAWRRQPGVTL